MVAKCHSLSRVGTVFHEVPLPGGRKPDISFTYPGENTVGFIADVTAISDEGLHNANPVQDLSQELVRLAHRVGLDPNHLRYDVRGQQEGPYGYQKTKLQLPPQLDLPGFLDARILPFLENIRDNQVSQDQITIDEDNIPFTISYDVSQRFMGEDIWHTMSPCRRKTIRCGINLSIRPASLMQQQQSHRPESLRVTVVLAVSSDRCVRNFYGRRHYAAVFQRTS